MPDAPKTLVRLAAKLAKHWAEKISGEEVWGDLAEVLAEFAGDGVAEKLANFFDQGEKAQKLLEAFKDADACFAEKCGDERLKWAIRSLPLAGLETLTKLAAVLPETLDDAGLVAAIRRRFEEDWRGMFTPEQLDHAAAVYRECLDRPLAAKCGQLLPTLFRKVEHVEQMTGQLLAGQSELLTGQKRLESRFIGVARLHELGARQWLRPSPPKPKLRMIGREAEFNKASELLKPGAKAAITAVQGMPGVGKTVLAENLAAELDAQFPGGVLFKWLGSGFRSSEQANPILNEWGAYAFNGAPLPEGTQLAPDAVRALLAGHSPLLVALDDVWDLNAIEPLRQALPREACLLITTRHERLALDPRRSGVFAGRADPG